MYPTLCVSRTRIKKLSLSSPFCYSKKAWKDCVQEENKVIPLFNKNGYYWDRISGTCWLEINGEAYKYSTPELFKYELSLLDKGLEDKTMKAIKILMDEKLASRELRELWQLENQRRLIRQCSLETELKLLKIKRSK